MVDGEFTGTIRGEMNAIVSTNTPVSYTHLEDRSRELVELPTT